MSPPDPPGRHLTIGVDTAADAVVIRASGEIDIASGPRLVAAVARCLPDPPSSRPVILDLSGVSFVDSSGLRALIDSQRTLGELGGRLLLAAPSAAVTRLLDMVGLRDTFQETGPTGSGGG